ncbi:MAG: NTPase [Methanophagales archaeon]|nr:NTPase [Methanophagales archaeon]
MNLRIGITGKPKIGKSTVIKEVIMRLKAEGIAVGGMLTSEIHEEGRRIGFSIEDINTGVKGILAHVHQRGPKIGKYGVNLTDLDSIGAHSITNLLARPEPRIIIVDEIGPMELKSSKFIEAVENAVESEKHLIVSVHQRSDHELVRLIKSTFEIVEVTEQNRNELPTIILNQCLAMIV